MHLDGGIEHVMAFRRLFARPCASTLRVFGEHPVHLFAQPAGGTSPKRRGPISPAEPTESVESSTVAFFDPFETETDGSGVATCRGTQNVAVLCHCRCRRFRGVVRHEQKLGRVVCMGGVRRWWLECVCVDEGCEWDRCHGEEGTAVGPCLGLVGDREARFGKAEELVAEHVSDRCDDARGRSFLGADTHVRWPRLANDWSYKSRQKYFIPFVRGADT